MHMVAARLGFEKAMVGTRRATPCSDCMCSFGVRARTEMEIRCVKGMCGLKVA